MISFNGNQLDLEPKIKETLIQIADGIEVPVRAYLPIKDKIELIEYIVDNAIDESTGCSSPLRVEVFFALAVCKWYANITVDDVSESYDILETNGVINEVISAIPADEFKFLQDLVNSTIADITRYNNSAAGIIQMANRDSGSLSKTLSEIVGNVKNAEGLELLNAIKDVAGTD